MIASCVKSNQVPRRTLSCVDEDVGVQAALGSEREDAVVPRRETGEDEVRVAIQVSSTL